MTTRTVQLERILPIHYGATNATELEKRCESRLGKHSQGFVFCDGRPCCTLEKGHIGPHFGPHDEIWVEIKGAIEE